MLARLTSCDLESYELLISATESIGSSLSRDESATTPAIDPPSVDTPSSAKALIALVVGIRVLGRGAFGQKALRQVAKQAVELISYQSE